MNEVSLPGQVELFDDDDVCIICFDKMDDNNPFENICKICDKNAIKHGHCFDRYKLSNKTECPLCRNSGFIMQNILDISNINRSGQIVNVPMCRCTKIHIIIWSFYIVTMIFFILFHIFDKTGILDMRNNSTNT